MKTPIRSVEFIKGIRGTDPILEDGVPQVAFVGRSNVGKSSVINTLIERKNFVKSSSSPGKTREINFFLVNDNIYFVDLPGYGYARGKAKDQDQLQKMILWYLTDSGAHPVYVVHVIDACVGPTKQDLIMRQILRDNGLQSIILANKADKLKKNDKLKYKRELEKTLDHDVVMYSAKERHGKEEVQEVLFSGC